TPMLLAGDEFGRTQRGNNNAYCQDNEISWLDWAHADHQLITFTAALIALRRALPALRQDRWLSDAVRADGKRDVEWLSPQGGTMSVDDWHDESRHCFGQLLAPTDGDAAVLIVFNAESAPVSFPLPPGNWQRVLDSTTADLAATPISASTIEASAHGVVLLIRLE